MAFSKNDINIDPKAESDRIIKSMRQSVRRFHKHGVVIGISGGIDSSACLALCAKAFPKDKIFCIAMPESDSNPESAVLARELANKFGVQYIVEDLTAAVAGFGTYQRRDEAIKRVFPEFDATYKSKIVLPSALEGKDTLNVYFLTIISPEGDVLAQTSEDTPFATVDIDPEIARLSKLTYPRYVAE